MEALAFSARPPARPRPLYVLHGDEEFLKREALRTLRAKVLGPDADASAQVTFPGDKAQFAEVFDELETVGFFAPRRLVVVENADPFVTRYRAQLEKKVGRLPETGVLVLDVKTWMATTRLAKLVPDEATLVCKAPPPYKLSAWCVEWAQRRHQKQLPAAAANLLVELVGPDMGLLDQEILKLAIYVGDRGTIDAADVDRLVGNNREENVWQMFDHIGAGNTAAALDLLERLFHQGDAVEKILGGFGHQVRKLAQATRYVVLGQSLSAAIVQAGLPPFKVKEAERQLRHLGRPRALRLYDNLLALYMDLRGNSLLPKRTLFERFVVELARKA